MTTSSTATEPDASRRDRVLVMLANRENQRLVSEALETRYVVANGIGRSPIDLVLLDGVTLHREWGRLQALRQLAEPVFLPVLLASDRGDVKLVTRDLWRVVDDVIIRPIERAELGVRIEALLRARRLSLQLARVSTLYENERHVAHRLQVAGLPHEFPVVPGVAFSAFYRPGSDEALIGGDWYDVLRLADGRLVLTVGDVSGSGLDAAILMADVRQVLRGVAHVHPDPGVMLDAADRTLAADGTEPRQVTAFVGVFDPVTGFLAYASAGHPPALLRDVTGDVTLLTTSGLPLGIDPSFDRPTTSVEVPGDALLVVHTDGLTEATRDVVDGERRTIAAVASPAVYDAPDVALAVRNAVLDGVSQDDVAILAMRVASRDAAADAILRWQLDSADATAVRRTRLAVVERLEGLRYGAVAVFAAENVYSELVGNVVRHAAGEFEIVLDISASAPVLHVLDRGPGYRLLPRLPNDALSEQGRGLYLISEFTAEFSVTRRAGGGSHATAVLRR